MSRTQPSRSNRNRRGPARKPAPFDIWREPAPLPDSAPIAIPNDVSGLLRSLGDPPLLDGTSAGHYFASVVERAAAIAAALALSADLLAEPVE